MPATLKIMIFRGTPDTPSRRHTALFIEMSDGSNLMVHIVGEAPHFRKDMRENTRPDQSVRFLKEIFVANITGKTMAQIGAVAFGTQIRSGGDWNCQNWVSDALRAICAKNWITEHARSAADAAMMDTVNTAR
ncbi:hypothetical protein ABEF95_001855 [Exophiala dermatitidis]